MSESTSTEFTPHYDRHGDSYYDDTDVDGLKKSFDKIEPEVITVWLLCYCRCIAKFNAICI